MRNCASEILIRVVSGASFRIALSYRKQVDNFLFATENWKMGQPGELCLSHGKFLSFKMAPLLIMKVTLMSLIKI